jgi:hypothetical protein
VRWRHRIHHGSIACLQVVPAIMCAMCWQCCAAFASGRWLHAYEGEVHVCACHCACQLAQHATQASHLSRLMGEDVLVNIAHAARARVRVLIATCSM